MDRLFGRMRTAGLSASRLNQAKSLYGPFFRWAKRRGMTTRDPMADFQQDRVLWRRILLSEADGETGRQSRR